MFSSSNDPSQALVGRYTADGVLDNTFGNFGTTSIAGVSISDPSMALQSDGKIVIAGTSKGDFVVARLTSTGALDSSFCRGKGFTNFDLDGTATETMEIAGGVAIQPDGKIVVAGYEYANGNPPSSVLVARFNTDGSLDSSFAPNGFKLASIPAAAGDAYTFTKVNAVALQSDGNIIVSGHYDTGATASYANRHPMLMRFFANASITDAAPNVLSGNEMRCCQL